MDIEQANLHQLATEVRGDLILFSYQDNMVEACIAHVGREKGADMGDEDGFLTYISPSSWG